MSDKEYIGDGVYVHCDGEHVVLTTEDGYRTTNTIFLERSVVGALFDFIKRYRCGGCQKLSDTLLADGDLCPECCLARIGY